MPHRLPLYIRRMAWMALFCAVALFSFQPNAFAAKYQVPANHTLNQYEQEVVQLVNQERAKHNLKPLQVDNALSYTSRVKSQDMRDNNYFSHNSPKYGPPKQMVDDFGIPYQRGVAENIGVGYKTPAEVVKGWMESSGHRANILNDKMTHIGVGYVSGGKHRTYWTQQFIAR